MPMGSEQNNPTNLLGWEPWPHATPGWGGGGVLSPCPRPFADGHLEQQGTCRPQAALSASLTWKFVGSWPYLESQL